MGWGDIEACTFYQDIRLHCEPFAFASLLCVDRG